MLTNIKINKQLIIPQKCTFTAANLADSPLNPIFFQVQSHFPSNTVYRYIDSNKYKALM